MSRRSSLSALSLASAVHKPITKEEKEAANNKKSSPIKNVSAKNVSQIHFIDNKLIHDAAIPARALYIRHHLGRTTGLGKCLVFLLLFFFSVFRQKNALLAYSNGFVQILCAFIDT